jgi:hypothetical protein
MRALWPFSVDDGLKRVKPFLCLNGIRICTGGEIGQS